MRKFLVALAAVSSLFLASACGTSGGGSAGDSGSQAGDSGSQAETVPVDQWAAGFCADFSDWLTEIEAASTDLAGEIQPGDLDGAQAAIADLFQSATDITENLIADLEAGGAPDIEDGQGLVDDLVNRFGGFVDAAQAAKADTEAMTPTPESFQADAEELLGRFEEEVTVVGDSFAALDTDYPDQDLQRELTESCDF